MTSWDHGLTCLTPADLFSQAELESSPTHKRHLFLRQIDYRHTRGNKAFVKDHRLMRTEQFKKAIHNSLIKCDYPITGVTTHGCRRGGLSSARRDGVEADICMLYGMWKNQCSILGYDDLLGDRLTRTTEQF